MQEPDARVRALAAACVGLWFRDADPAASPQSVAGPHEREYVQTRCEEAGSMGGEAAKQAANADAASSSHGHWCEGLYEWVESPETGRASAVGCAGARASTSPEEEGGEGSVAEQSEVQVDPNAGAKPCGAGIRWQW